MRFPQSVFITGNMPFAQSELSRCLTAMTGAELRPEGYPFTVTAGHGRGEGYRVSVTGRHTDIQGESPRAAVYGVYALLERLGAQFLAEDCEILPSVTEWMPMSFSSRPDFAYRDDFIKTPETNWTYAWISYGYNYLGIGSNYYCGGNNDYNDPPSGIKGSVLKNASAIILLADSRYTASINRGYFRISDSWNNDGNSQIHTRHNGSANIVWADGHATGETNAMRRFQVAPFIHINPFYK